MILDQRYRLEELVGKGASSAVFAATDTRLERLVALKILRTEFGADDALRARFDDEARTLAKLRHPHVVAIHDAGQTADGIAFLVMELASHGTLEHELCARGRLSAQELIPLLLPVIGALAYAHDHGIVHRDLKPANIVIDGASASQWQAKVLDFGIAARRDIERTSRQVAGTPAYMAPEQVLAGEMGPPVDVWAMGALLFRALSSQLPFDGPTRAALLRKIVHERAPRLATVCPEIGQRLGLAIDRALEPHRELRYRDMREFARALAIACRLDGICVPDAPDPLGLPRFGAWLAEADLQSTADLDPSSALQSPPYVSVRSITRKLAVGWAVPVASALLVGAVAVSLALVLGRERGPGASDSLRRTDASRSARLETITRAARTEVQALELIPAVSPRREPAAVPAPSLAVSPAEPDRPAVHVGGSAPAAPPALAMSSRRPGRQRASSPPADVEKTVSTASTEGTIRPRSFDGPDSVITRWDW